MTKWSGRWKKVNDRLLSLLGLARRAGRLSVGHDAAIEAIVKKSAKLCIVCSDGSQRLKREMEHACGYGGKKIRFFEIYASMSELSKAIGSKAAVLTVNDAGFADAAANLVESEREKSEKADETAGKE